MTIEPSQVARNVIDMAQNPNGQASRDITVLACWTSEQLLLSVFTSTMLLNPDTPRGLIYDLHPEIDRITTDLDSAELAYTILTYELVEPNHYPHTLSVATDAIAWRIAGGADFDAISDALPRTLSDLPI